MIRDYWNSRFLNEGKIWGISPSKSAKYCLELFRNYEVKNVLIPGSGYGRHTKFFSDNRYKVLGIEISEVAVEISKEFDSQSEFINRSILDMKDLLEKFDSIFCFNVLHLFTMDDRNKFINNCYTQMSPGGICFFTVFSDKETSFGNGKEIEKHTFESKPGRPTHYFTEEDLIDHFKDYHILETGIIEEPENHGSNGPHTHVLRYILAKKLK